MRSRGYRGRTSGGLLGVLGSSALSALAVIALVGVLLLMFGQRAQRIDQVVARATTTASPQPSAQAPIPVAPAPIGVPAARPVPSATAAAVLPSPAATALPTATPDHRVPVVIFDQTRRHDVVVAFRNALRAAGWEVAGTGPWVGKVPLTTVYYPAGMEGAARALMLRFPAITRSLPAFPGVPSDELTVIICSDFRVS